MMFRQGAVTARRRLYTLGPMSAPGEMIGGRFTLLAPLGSGGMGTVWRARDEVLHREVALKEVRPPDPAMTGPEAAATLRERVLREARALARLSHPHVVTIHQIVDAGAGTHPWIVMELVPGESLADRLQRGPLLPQEAATLGRQLLAALRSAHAAGIHHRDVKPANILLRTDPGVPGPPSAVLTDFGIAALQGSTALTATGDLIGSPEYIAPERVRGRDDHPASDLWSLGLVLYVAVEGHSPLRRATTLATLAAVLDEPVPPPVRSGPLAAVLGALLVRDPRPPDAATLDRLLTEAASGSAPSWAEPTVSGPARSRPPRHPPRPDHPPRRRRPGGRHPGTRAVPAAAAHPHHGGRAPPPSHGRSGRGRRRPGRGGGHRHRPGPQPLEERQPRRPVPVPLTDRDPVPGRREGPQALPRHGQHRNGPGRRGQERRRRGRPGEGGRPAGPGRLPVALGHPPTPLGRVVDRPALLRAGLHRHRHPRPPPGRRTRRGARGPLPPQRRLRLAPSRLLGLLRPRPVRRRAGGPAVLRREGPDQRQRVRGPLPQRRRVRRRRHLPPARGLPEGPLHPVVAGTSRSERVEEPLDRPPGGLGRLGVVVGEFGVGVQVARARVPVDLDVGAGPLHPQVPGVEPVVRLEGVVLGDVQLDRQVLGTGVVRQVRGPGEQHQATRLLVGEGEVLRDGAAQREPRVDQPLVRVRRGGPHRPLQQLVRPDLVPQRQPLLHVRRTEPLEQIRHMHLVPGLPQPPRRLLQRRPHPVHGVDQQNLHTRILPPTAEPGPTGNNQHGNNQHGRNPARQKRSPAGA
ncbi:serine/threonine protein kinase [Streptomyces sp. FR-008]|nr:serine/threonine protein kinase [Streptomyces sp. FR-008]